MTTIDVIYRKLNVFFTEENKKGVTQESKGENKNKKTRKRVEGMEKRKKLRKTRQKPTNQEKRNKTYKNLKN